MFRRQCNLPSWAFPESVSKGYFIITWKLMRMLVFLVLPSWEADRAFLLHLIWLLTAWKPSHLSQWLTLRPHQILLWKLREAQRKLCSTFSFWEKSNQLLEDGIYRAGKQRWKGELRRECLVNPIRHSCCIPLSAAQEKQAGCGGSESAPLHVFESWHWRLLHNPDPCSCASSAALLTLAAAPAFYAGFETKQNVSVAEEGMRDVRIVRYFYKVAHLWDRYLQRTQLNKSDLKSILWSTCSSHFKVSEINQNNEPGSFVFLIERAQYSSLTQTPSHYCQNSTALELQKKCAVEGWGCCSPRCILWEWLALLA